MSQFDEALRTRFHWLRRNAPGPWKWLKEFTDRTKPILQELKSKGVAPTDVVEFIGICKFSSVPDRLPDRREREKAARRWEKAADEIDRWGSFLWFSHLDSFTDPLRDAAKKMRVIKAPRTGPHSRRVNDCTKGLAKLFRSRNIPYRYVGELVKAAFPDEWNPAGDKANAIEKKL